MKRSRSGMRDMRAKGRGTVKILERVVVCCTGVKPALKEVLREKVEGMGGSFDVNLTLATTHLLAASADTEKYIVATSMKAVTIVRPEWVLDSSKEGRKVPCEEYSLPPFEGLRITITGLSFDRKEELRTLIVDGGGEYMGAMEARRTTHLVAEAPTGAKYMAAISPEWRSSIKVVHSRWVEQSYFRQLRLPEQEFPVVTRPEQPDKMGEDETEKRRGRDEVESRLTGDDVQQKKDQQYDAREQPPPSTSRTSHAALDPAALAAGAGTTSTAVAAERVASEGQSSAARVADRSLYPWSDRASGAPNELADRTGEGGRKAEGIPSVAEALALPDGDYLSGCRVMLVGFAVEDLRPLTLLIRKGCGVRYAFPNEEISHVVLGDQALAKPEIVAALESHPCTPSVVMPSWLWETCCAGRILPTDRYLHAPPTVPDRSRSDAGSGHSGRGSGGSGGGGGGGRSGGNRRFGVGARKSQTATVDAPVGSAALGSHPGDPPSKGGGATGLRTSGQGPPGENENEPCGLLQGNAETQHVSVGRGEGAASECKRQKSWHSVEVLHEEDAMEDDSQREDAAQGMDVGGGNSGSQGRGLAADTQSLTSSNAHKGSAGRKRQRTEHVVEGNARGAAIGSTTKARSSSSRSSSSRMFHGLVFVLRGTGLSKEEEDRTARLVTSHGGRCVDMSDISSASSLRQALRSAGLELEHESENAEGVDQRQRQRCIVITAHGKWPWIGLRVDGGDGCLGHDGACCGCSGNDCSHAGCQDEDGGKEAVATARDDQFGCPLLGGEEIGTAGNRTTDKPTVAEPTLTMKATRGNGKFEEPKGVSLMRHDCTGAQGGASADIRSDTEADVENGNIGDSKKTGSIGAASTDSTRANKYLEPTTTHNSRRCSVGRMSHGDNSAHEEENVAYKASVGVGRSSKTMGGVTHASLVSSSLGGLMRQEAWVTLAAEARPDVVTILWVEACHRVGELRPPAGCEKVFCPRPWPIQKFPILFFPASIPEDNAQGNRCAKRMSGMQNERATRKLSEEGGDNRMVERGKVFAIAVTGFVGAERTGWEQLILAMGAEMCKSLRKRDTTHLVCKEAKGEKYKTALKWGVQVVTAEWLLHCSQHGYEIGAEGVYHPVAALSLGRPPPPRVTPKTSQATHRCHSCDEACAPTPSESRQPGRLPSFTGAEVTERNSVHGSTNCRQADDTRATGMEASQAAPEEVNSQAALGEGMSADCGTIGSPPCTILTVPNSASCIAPQLTSSSGSVSLSAITDTGPSLAAIGNSSTCAPTEVVERELVCNATKSEPKSSLINDIVTHAAEPRAGTPTGHESDDDSKTRSKSQLVSGGDIDGDGGVRADDAARSAVSVSPVKPMTTTAANRSKHGQGVQNSAEGKSGLELQLRLMMNGGSSAALPTGRRRRPFRPNPWGARSTARNSSHSPDPPRLMHEEKQLRPFTVARVTTNSTRAGESVAASAAAAAAAAGTILNPGSTSTMTTSPPRGASEPVSASPGGSTPSPSSRSALQSRHHEEPSTPDRLPTRDELMMAMVRRHAFMQAPESVRPDDRRVLSSSFPDIRAEGPLRDAETVTTESSVPAKSGGGGYGNDHEDSSARASCSPGSTDSSGNKDCGHAEQDHGFHQPRQRISLGKDRKRRLHNDPQVEAGQPSSHDERKHLRALKSYDSNHMHERVRRRDNWIADNSNTGARKMSTSGARGSRFRNGSSGVTSQRNANGIRVSGRISDEPPPSPPTPSDETREPIEEESQIVTYGEQYNPITGWIK